MPVKDVEGQGQGSAKRGQEEKKIKAKAQSKQKSGKPRVSKKSLLPQHPWFWISDEDKAPRTDSNGNNPNSSCGGFNADDGKTIEFLYKMTKEERDAVKPFTFCGRLMPACIDLHDGDTGNIIVKYRGEIQKYPLRFFGCDAPELHPSEKQSVNPELEAKAARKVLAELTKEIARHNDGGMIWVKFAKNEKLGRKMGKLYAMRQRQLKHSETLVFPKSPIGTEVDLVQWLIDRRYAKEYYGEKKELWTEEELNFILDN